MKRSVYGFLISLFLVAMITVACGQASTPTPSPSPKPTPSPAAKPTPSATTATEKPITIQWITGKEGGTGYALGASLAMLIGEEIPELIGKVDVRPLGSGPGMQRIESGESQVSYVAMTALHQQWNNLDLWAKKPTPADRRSLQGFHTHTLAFVLMVPERLAGEIKSIEDLAGRRIFATFPGGSLFQTTKVILEALGIFNKIEYADLPYNEVAGALEARRIDAVVGYQSFPSLTPVDWMVELSTRTRLVVLPLTEPQIKKVREAVVGRGVGLVEMEVPYIKPKPTGKFAAWTQWNGFAFSPDLPEKYGYAIVKTVIEKASKKSAAVDIIREFAEAPLKMQELGIESIVDAPIHPGLAKYLQEKGVWKSNWKIGKLTTPK